jgi:hypothetical protein
MDKEGARDPIGNKLVEIERLVREFKEKFEAGTSDTENFMTMFEVEQIWSELRDNTNNVYSDMVQELMSAVDERDLIRKKKREYKRQGITLRTHIKTPVSIIAALGQTSYSRYSLIPQDADSKKKLMETFGAKSVFPLDCRLGLAGLPFKITPAAMLKIAFWAQNQSSYQRAEDAISEIMHIKINDDTVRLVTNFVGNVVFDNDCRKADEAFAALDSGKLPFPKDLDGVLYIQTDGAALNTRHKDNDGSTWRENKLGEVFSSKNTHYWTDKKGKRRRQILKKEYISYIGSVSEFRKHLLACALRGGYGRFKETVILSDGATWIRNMAEELFPDAQHILDFFHLCENVNTYAKHLFNMDESKYRPWAKDVCDSLKKSDARSVLRELDAYTSTHLDNCPVNLRTYISNNTNNIDYATYEEKGYFVGSGAIESGNKIVLQDRLKRAGMRWNTATAQAMLTLKSKAESNLWSADVEKPFLTHCFSLSNPSPSLPHPPILP